MTIKKSIRKIAFIFASVLAVTVITACSSDGTEKTDEKVKDVAVSDITKAVLNEIEIPSAVEKDTSSVSDYYDIDTDILDSASFYLCGSGAYPDELAVFKVIESRNVETIKSAAEKRLENQIKLFETYTPDEMYKLNDAKIFTKGNYVCFVAVSDNTLAESIINGHLS